MGLNYNSSQKFQSLVEINIAYAHATNIKKRCLYIVLKVQLMTWKNSFNFLSFAHKHNLWTSKLQ